jgi:hypothetical protein
MSPFSRPPPGPSCAAAHASRYLLAASTVALRVRTTESSFACGHRNRPRSSRLANRHKPCPSHHSTLITWPNCTSFSIPIAICCGGVSLASATRQAPSHLRPAGACRRQILYIEVRPGLSREIPARMCDAAVCAAISIGSSRVAIGALTELRAVLDTRSVGGSSDGSLTPSTRKGGSDETSSRQSTGARS